MNNVVGEVGCDCEDAPLVEQPTFSFGVISDIQYADVPNRVRGGSGTR